MRDELKSRTHWVIKIGSGVLVRDGIHIDRPTFASIVQDVDALLRDGHRVTIVSSGAVALGRQVVQSEERPKDLPMLQALAALGQAKLIQMYDHEFRQYDRRAAQILFGRADLDRRDGYLNARMTLDAVHEFDAVPIINENDSVGTDGIRFDDNDQLAALTCGVVSADLLVILSDVTGVLDVTEQDGERKFGDRISEIDADSDQLTQVAGPSASGVGTGGMISKVRAARIAARVGVPTVIAPGKQTGILRQVQAGHDVGTVIRPSSESLQGRKVWLDSSAVSQGVLHCDRGARKAIIERGASLLPSGVQRVEGDFPAGAVVDIADDAGEVFARGLCMYSSTDAAKIAGVQSEKIVEILGYKRLDALVHRDGLVVV